MAKYLVTGGCGFVGSNLVKRLLNDKHQVFVLDDLSTGNRNSVPSNCKLIVGDITNKETVHKSMEGMDGCFHLAAINSVQQSNVQWVRTHQVNLGGSINVLDAAKLNSTPVVYTSSASVYGDNADIPLREISSVSPMTAYGADKLGVELHCRVASLIHGIPTTGLRLFNVYGKRQTPVSQFSDVISVFIDRLLNDQAIQIFGDGKQTRDFIYIDDVVEHLVCSMDSIGKYPRIFNVCTGVPVSINQLAKTMMSITHSICNIEQHPARKGDIRSSVGDPLMAKNILGIAPRYSLSEGLKTILIDAQQEVIQQIKMVGSY